MHWFELPKGTRNEDAIREYERVESGKIRKWGRRLALAGFILVVVIIWIVCR